MQNQISNLNLKPVAHVRRVTRIFVSPQLIRYGFASVRALHALVLIAVLIRAFTVGFSPSGGLVAAGLAIAIASQIFVVNIVGHRFIGHAGFSPSALTSFLLLLWTVLAGLSSPLSSSLLHRRHHQNPDSERDPHSPPHGSAAMVPFFARIYFNFLFEKNFSMREVMRESRRPFFIFFHRYGAYISLAASAVLYTMLGLEGLFCLQTIPVLICFLGQFNLVFLTHVPEKQGSNHSVDSVLANVLTLGEGAHASHHQMPRKTFYESDRIAMFDLSGYLIKSIWKK